MESLSVDRSREFLYRMKLIRAVQLKIEEVYHLDEMKTPVHLYIGQEGIAVGVCSALSPTDYVFSNHRGHGHYLAKGGNLKSMIAELYCRETGCSKGRGGSMHLVDLSVGLMGSSSIVAGGISIAVGAAFTSVLKGENNVSVVFFGDGASEEGVLYESINFAVLRKLPVLFVCENNFYAVCSPLANRQSEKNIYQRFSGLGLPCELVDGTDVLAVNQVANKLIAEARLGNGPAFIECQAYRWRGHSGAGADTALGYRSETELLAWLKQCPIERFEETIVTSGLMNSADFVKMEEVISSEVDDAFQYAIQSPLPKAEDVERYVYAGLEGDE